MGHGEPTLFVVDDELTVRQSVTALARAAGLRCEGYASAEDFLAAFDPDRTGCLVLDLRLEGMSGLEVLGRLRQMGSLLPVIVLSGYVDVAQAVEAMRCGAFTVLEKPCAPGRLVQEVRKAAEWDHCTRSLRQRRQMVRRRIQGLEPRERQVLSLVLEDWPNRVIARELGVSQRTVDRLRAGVYAKLGVGSAVEAARLIGLWDDLSELPAEQVPTEVSFPGPVPVCPKVSRPHWPVATR